MDFDGCLGFFYFVTTMFGNQKKITRSKHLCVLSSSLPVAACRCEHCAPLFFPVKSSWRTQRLLAGSCWPGPCFFLIFCLSLKYIGLCLHSFLSFDFIWFDFFVGVSLAVVATRHLLCGTWFSQAEFSKKFIRFSVFSYKIYSVFIKFRMNYVHWISLYTFITVII